MNIGMRWGSLAEGIVFSVGLCGMTHNDWAWVGFAYLMGFVECATHCPLMYHQEGKRSWEAAQAKRSSLGFGRWEDLSEAMREHWVSMLVSAALKGSLDEVLR